MRQDSTSFDDVKRNIVSVCHEYYRKFSPTKVFSPIFSRAELYILRVFASDKSLIVTKLDKGKGVVILDRSSYIEKMDTIVNDRSKFTVVADPILKTI